MKLQKSLCVLGILFFMRVLSATTVPSGVGFAGSYLERASGIEALQLNPANIDKKLLGAEYMFFSFAFGLSENFFATDLVLGEEGRLLSSKEKSDILDKMYKSAIARGNAQLLLAGFSYDRWAISTSLNAFGYGRLDKKLFEIALEGNEYGVRYNFSKNTGMAGVLYQDITVGYGGEVINGWVGEYIGKYINKGWFEEYIGKYLENSPDILVGVSASYLLGTKMYEIDELRSEIATEALINTDEEFTQAAVVRESEKGIGFKMNLGFSSQVYTIQEDHYVTAGMSFDNLFGFIQWNRNKYHNIRYDVLISNNKYEFTHVETDVDDAYADPVWVDETHTSFFPITYRLGGKYVYKNMSGSLDFEQNFWKHAAFSHTPEISLGYEYIIGKRWPVHIGYRVPCWDFLAAYSFGAAYKSPFFEIGFGLSVEDSMNYRFMKGMSFATYTKYRFDW